MKKYIFVIEPKAQLYDVELHNVDIEGHDKETRPTYKRWFIKVKHSKIVNLAEIVKE